MVSLEQFVDMHIKLMKKVESGNPGYWEWFRAMGQRFGPGDIDKVDSRRVQKRFRSEIKACYANAWMVHIINPEYKYFVGFVDAVIPIEHAWLVKDEKVVDPTMAINVRGDKNRFGKEYFGVEVVQLSKKEIDIPDSFDLFKVEILDKKKGGEKKK